MRQETNIDINKGDRSTGGQVNVQSRKEAMEIRRDPK